MDEDDPEADRTGAAGRVVDCDAPHRGRAVDGDTGWYVESWAGCDLAELPPEAAARQGLQVWTDRAGRRVPVGRVTSSAGPEHCDWQQMTFLGLDGGALDGGQTYVQDPDPTYYPDYVTVRYERDVPLPEDAEDTGWQRDGRRLWLARDRSRAFVGTEQSVQVWPAPVQQFACA